MTKQKHLLLTLALFLLLPEAINAQDHTTPTSDSVYSKVDVLPEFPGGMKALGKYVDGRKSHKYPKEAQQNKIEGKVIIEFIIHEDGTPGDFKVIQGLG